jgi:hypothetical protein
MTYTQLQVYKKLQKFVQATGNAFPLFISDQNVYKELKEYKKQKAIPPHHLKLKVSLISALPNHYNTTVTTVIDVSKITKDSQLLNLYALILDAQAPAMEGVEQVRCPMQMEPAEGMFSTEPVRHQHTSVLGGLFKQPIMSSAFSDKFANKTGTPTFHSNYYSGAIRELFEKKKKFVIKMDKVTGHPRSMQSPGTMQQITRICLPMDSRVAEKTRTLSPLDPARACWVAHPLNVDCEVFRIIETYENNNFLREVMLMPVGLLAGKWPSYTVDLSSPVINALHAAARMIEKTDPVLVEILMEINLSAERSAQAEPYRHPHADAIRELLTESRMVLDIEQQSSNYTELSQVTHIYLAPDIRATAKVLSLPDSDPDKARWMAHPGYGKYEIFKLTENYSQRGGLTGMKLEAVYADAPSDCIYIYDGLLSVNDAISLIKQKVEKRMEELDPILEKAEQELCTGRLLEEAKPELSPRIAELNINVESFVKEINAFHLAYKTKAITESEKTTTLRKAILTFLVDKGAEVEEGPCEEEGDWKTGGYVRQTQVYEPADAEIARMLELLNPEQPDRAYLEAHPMAVRYELFRIVEKIQNKGEVVKMYFEVSASLSSTPLKFDIPLSADVEKNMLLAEYMLVNQRHLLANRIEQHQKNKPVQDSQS